MKLNRTEFRVTLLVFMLISLVANGLMYWRLNDIKRTYDNWSSSVEQIEVVRTKGGLLQVSTIRSPEYFKSTKPHDILGVDLGATITQIRVPATYHYQIELAREWKVRVQPDRTVVVIAPSVKPSLPIAIDTSKLEQSTEGSWSLLTGPKELNNLQKTITEVLSKRASSPSYIKLQRDAARATVSEFIRTWLLTQERWKSVRDLKLRVYFADEQISELPEPIPSPSRPEL